MASEDDEQPALPGPARPSVAEAPGRRIELAGLGLRLGALTVGVLAVVIPVLWVIVSRHDRNTGDMALIELRVRDVLSSHIPVTGAYSRYGWSHPGPWLFYLFAVPYRLLGNDARALQLTTLLFNVGVASAVMWLAARRNTATAVVVGLAMVLLVRGLQPMAIAYGWNVTVTALPFVLVAIACWRALNGDRWALPVATAATMFVVQAHVGVGVVVTPMFLVTVALVAARWYRLRGDDCQDRPRWSVTLAILMVSLAPVVYDVVARPTGNLGRLIRWSWSNDEPQVGFRAGFRMIGRTSSLSFLRDPELPGRFLLELGPVDPGLLPGLSIALLVAAGLVAHRRAWHEELTLCSLIGLGWVAGAVAVASITEPLGWWLVDWLQPLGWLTWTAIGLVAWRVGRAAVAARHREHLHRWTLAAVAVVATVAIVDHGRAAVSAPDRTAEFARPVDDLTDAIVERVGDQPVRIDPDGTTLLAETMLSGVVNRLDALGRDTCVAPDLAYKLGGFRVCTDPPAHRFLIRAEAHTSSPPDDLEVVAVSDPLSQTERAEADVLYDRVAAVLVANGLDAQVGILDTPLADVVLLGEPPAALLAVAADVERLAELQKVPGDRYVLYVAM